MGILEKGKYLGKYKVNDIYYHSFKPETIAVEGKVVYVRIGDRNEEFATDRAYMLHLPNEEETKLIAKKK